MNSSINIKNLNKFYHFHYDHGHNIEECHTLEIDLYMIHSIIYEERDAT